MALDKDKATIKLDLNAKKILQAPDNKVTLTSVEKQADGSYDIDLRLESPGLGQDQFGYTLFEKVID
jgi:hypothetical protein